jgi:hypothetical protein
MGIWKPDEFTWIDVVMILCLIGAGVIIGLMYCVIIFA